MPKHGNTSQPRTSVTHRTIRIASPALRANPASLTPRLATPVSQPSREFKVNGMRWRIFVMADLSQRDKRLAKASLICLLRALMQRGSAFIASATTAWLVLIFANGFDRGDYIMVRSDGRIVIGGKMNGAFGDGSFTLRRHPRQNLWTRRTSRRILRPDDSIR